MLLIWVLEMNLDVLGSVATCGIELTLTSGGWREKVNSGRGIMD